MARKGNETFVFAKGGRKKKDGELDARVLAIRENEEEGRHIPFREAVEEMTVTDWEKFPIQGPQTAMWCLRFIRDQDIAPRSRHTKWRSEVSLLPSDPCLLMHEFCCRIL